MSVNLRPYDALLVEKEQLAPVSVALATGINLSASVDCRDDMRARFILIAPDLPEVLPGGGCVALGGGVA